MQKKDIKAGVLYGYARGTSDYRTAIPLIVLDVTGLWTWHRTTRSSEATWKPSTYKKYTTGSGGWSSYSGPHGYLVLHGVVHLDAEKQAQHLAEMKALAVEFAATDKGPDAVNELAAKVRKAENISLEAVNNRWITGDYVEAKNEEKERREARNAEWKAERDRAAAEREFINEVAELMEAKLERKVHVVSDRSWGLSRASIPMEDLAAFLGIKPPKDRL